MFDSSTFGAGLWLWLPFLSSQGIGYGQLPPLDGSWFDGIAGEQESVPDGTPSRRFGSDARPIEDIPRFRRRRRFRAGSLMPLPPTSRTLVETYSPIRRTLHRRGGNLRHRKAVQIIRELLRAGVVLSDLGSRLILLAERPQHPMRQDEALHVSAGGDLADHGRGHVEVSLDSGRALRHGVVRDEQVG